MGPELLLVGAALVGLYLLLHMTLLQMPRCESDVKLDGKTVIVTGESTETLEGFRQGGGTTGANTGIGKTTAMDLARRGARVIMACRDQGRAEAAIKDIIQETGNHQVIFMQLDLSSLQSVRSFAENFLQSESRLDILINNAGVFTGGMTEDGVGMIFGVNHLGHFLLTVLLLDRLKASGPSRVVTVSSEGHKGGKVDFNCLRTHRDLSLGNNDFQLFQKYCHSKLCNVLFTIELAKRLEDSEVTCYSMHPGVIKTELGRYTGFLWKLVVTPLVLPLCVDAVSGAQTTLHCALAPGIEHLSGHYFSRCAPQVNLKARDEAAAKKLWELSESFCGLS